MFLIGFYQHLYCLMSGKEGVDAKSTNGANLSLTPDTYYKLGEGNYAGAQLALMFNSNYNFAPYSGKIRTAYNDSGGVIFGDGTVAPALSDTKLSGNIITGIVGTANLTQKIDATGFTFTADITVTNNNNAPVTISEMGRLVARSSTHTVLIERTLLEKPLTIEAGGTGKIMYESRFDFPV